jgi:hypothetical protein
MFATIQNVYPLAFVETYEDKGKERVRRCEEDEMAERNKWQVCILSVSLSFILFLQLTLTILILG